MLHALLLESEWQDKSLGQSREEEKPVSQAHCTTYLWGNQYYSRYNTEQITECHLHKFLLKTSPITCTRNTW